MKQSTSLQLVVSKGTVAKHSYLPLAITREQIFKGYMDGRSEHEVAANLKIPVAQVRLVLRGYQEIYYRVARAAAARCPQWGGRVEQQITDAVWRRLRDRPLPPAPARRAA